MKYFTPELWLGMQAGVDNQTFLAAYDAWERNRDAYEEQLTRIIPHDRKYRDLRLFAKQQSLHDAMVTACWFDGSSKLKLQARPEPPEERLVLLEYTLTREPAIFRDRLPPEYRTDFLRWMYDELGVLPEPGALSLSRASETGGDDEVVFTHNILLSNGWELEIAFSRLKVTRHQAVWPVSNGQTAPQPARLPRTG
jgi:hypothetical protein